MLVLEHSGGCSGTAECYRNTPVSVLVQQSTTGRNTSEAVLVQQSTIGALGRLCLYSRIL